MSLNWSPLWLSLRVAGIATVISLGAGIYLAYVLANRAFRGKDLLDAAVTLPLTLPPTVLGYYLLVVIGHRSPIGQAYEWLFRAPLVFTWQAAVLASTIHAIPLLVRTARAALLSVNHDLERAARTLGASEWRLFWRITLPLTRRSIISATVLAFARSLGDFGTTLMIAGDIPGRTQTASIAIYDAVESGDHLTAQVLVVVISALTIAIVWIANRLEDRRTQIAGASTRAAHA
jgi:molybdate transport system permease protein